MGVMELIPITDPTKRVTDPEIIKLAGLKKWNLDFVEFSDYAKERPYGKLYTAYETGENVLVTSGLPMVRGTDGSKIVPGFEQVSNGKYWIKNNLFDGYVSGTGEIHLAAVNDQPDGVLAGDEGHWNPVLSVGKEIVTPVSVTVMETDPINDNMHDNVIEFDYGVCKRRIRLIQGRFRGSWVFDKNPGADVMIEYNRTGKMFLELGRAYDGNGNPVNKVVLPEKQVELVPADAWEKVTGPVTIGDSATFYPDAHEESATVDGYFDWDNQGGSNAAYDNVDAGSSSGETYDSNGEIEWRYYSAYLFDTSDLNNGKVTAAEIQIYGLSQFHNDHYNDYELLVGSINPSSNTQLVASDIGSISLHFYERFLSSSFIPNSSWTNGAYNTLTLSSYGIANISTNGISKFSLGGNYLGSAYEDASHYTTSYFAEKGEGYKPKLIVTYTPWNPVPVFANHYARMRRR